MEQLDDEVIYFILPMSTILLKFNIFFFLIKDGFSERAFAKKTPEYLKEREVTIEFQIYIAVILHAVTVFF